MRTNKSLHLTERLGEQDTLFIHTYLTRKHLGQPDREIRSRVLGWATTEPGFASSGKLSDQNRNMMQIEPVAWSISLLNAIKHKQAEGRYIYAGSNVGEPLKSHFE